CPERRLDQAVQARRGRFLCYGHPCPPFGLSVRVEVFLEKCARELAALIQRQLFQPLEVGGHHVRRNALSKVRANFTLAWPQPGSGVVRNELRASLGFL